MWKKKFDSIQKREKRNVCVEGGRDANQEVCFGRNLGIDLKLAKQKQFRRHRGVLYVFVLILMLVITTLSLMTAFLFDNNLKNAVVQKNSLQLYYYAKAGSDWALDLLRTEVRDLNLDSTLSSMDKNKKLLLQLQKGQTWTAEQDLDGGDAEDGHVKVTVEVVSKTVDAQNVIVKPGTPGGTLKPYIRITAIGTYKDNPKYKDEKYVMTALVAQDNHNHVIYKVGEDK